ncbi:MAG: nucleoside kinase [Planctomycetes bacterium]|nr:nucleoside kinase [Planctomycetota bacterium]
MKDTIRIKLPAGLRAVSPGVTVAELLGVDASTPGDVIAATLNNHLVSLETRVDGDAQLRPVTRFDREGQGILRRACAHLLLAVAAQRDPALELAVGQSLLGGHFYEVRSPEGIPADLSALAQELNATMAQIVEADLPFERLTAPVEGAGRLLHDPSGSKRALLRYWPGPVVNLVRFLGLVDIQHGPFPPSSGYAAGARVVAYPPGLILQFAEGEQPPVTPEQGRTLWGCYSETRDWNRQVGIATLGDLNAAILEDRIEEVQQLAEAFHEKKIAQLADQIAARAGQIRVVCVAGPSSAGKTTFVRRLSVQLKVNGIQPVCIGLDDYYRPHDQCPRDQDGGPDLEALEALDVPLIHTHLERLLAGEEVRLPSFDFVRHRPTPESTWRPLRLQPDQVLLLEGIHGLNPALTAGVPPASRFRIYLNALTQLVIDDHNRIFTSDGRLLRRIVRDRRYRGTPAAETLARWGSVRRGEDRHIYPYQEECEGVFNSTLIYEAAVLKTFAQRYLLEVPQDHPSRVEAYRLLKFLELFVPVFPDVVPANSVLREFIGGSGFSY